MNTPGNTSDRIEKLGCGHNRKGLRCSGLALSGQVSTLAFRLQHLVGFVFWASSRIMLDHSDGENDTLFTTMNLTQQLERWFRDAPPRRSIFLVAVVPMLFRSAGFCQTTSGREVGTREFFLAFCCVVIVGIAANAYLVGLVRPGERASRFQRFWEFYPSTFGGFSWQKLAVWSFLSLFMELLMIRWISSEIRIFAYFKNFVLIACFLGFGLGCYLSRRKTNLLLMLLPLLMLTTMVEGPWLGLRAAISQLPSWVAASAGTQFWEAPSVLALPALAAATAVIVPIFGLLVFFFVPMGQMVGWYLENASNGIVAYSVNVFAALCGILAYTLLCFFSQPPVIWFVAGGALLILLVWKVPQLRWSSLAALVLCSGLFLWGTPNDMHVYWSPYQKLTLGTWGTGREVLGYYLNTNDSWYQQILDLSPKFVQAHPGLFEKVPVEWNPYNIPYHFYQKPNSVLVLGSGMGNDVAAALRNGASGITAVEIDPLILKLGKQFHYEKPYDSPRVREVTDDARSYIENSYERFDLIVFSLLDSHTTSSSYTNIRIDNYVYTIEALEAAKRLLKPDGVFVVKFQVDTPFIAGRLNALMSQVFGHSPVQLEADATIYSSVTGAGGRFFISGSEKRIANALQDPVLSKYVEQHQGMKMAAARVTTDDWPYFYQRSHGLPLAVVVISTVLLLLGLMLLRDMGTRIKSVRWHFFFLGAGFLLLEAAIISKMALLFGTTWMVNSIVIGSLLLLVLTANAITNAVSSIPVGFVYGVLFVTLFVGFFVPVRTIFFHSLMARVLAGLLVLCLPVFFAGLIFIRSFAQEGFSAEALGANLLGAMVGGMLESASLWTGIRSLSLVASLLYFASWIALRARFAKPIPAESGSK